MDLLGGDILRLVFRFADLPTLLALKPTCRHFRQLARLTIKGSLWRLNHEDEFRVHCWREGKHEATILTNAHDGRAYSVALGERLIASGGTDSRLHLFDASSLSLIQTEELAERVSPNCLCSCKLRIGTEAAMETDHFFLRGHLYSPNEDWTRVDRVPFCSGRVDLIACDPLALSRDYVIVYIQGATATMRKRDGRQHSIQLDGGYTPNTLAVGCGTFAVNGGPRGKRVQVYSLDDHGQHVITLLGHTQTVYAIATTSFRLASGSDDRMINLWNTTTGTVLCRIDTGAKVWALAIDVSGRILVSGGHGNSVGDIHLWDLQQVPRDIDGHHEGLSHAVRLASLGGPPSCTRSLAFDGDRVVAGGNDGRIRVWQHPGGTLRDTTRDFF